MKTKTKTIGKQSVPILTLQESRQVRLCLDLLQEAQNIVDLAAQQLCSVRGFANEWSRLNKPHDAIKRAWHDVESRRGWLASIEHAHLAPAVSMPDDPAPRRRRRRLGDDLEQVRCDQPVGDSTEADESCSCPECGVALPSGATCCTACSWSL